jgi:glycine hydroxymethyltransferase
LNGGPHNHQIAAVAVQLKEVASQEFKDYSTQVVKNAKALGEFLKGYGYTLVTGGTDNHLLLWDLRPQKINGAKVQTICDLVHITLNKNSVPGDTSALVPGGVRVGAPAMTSRGLVESDFKTIAEMLDRVIKICTKIQDAALQANENGPDVGKCLQKHFDSNLHVAKDDIEKLKADVAEFGCKFPIPGRFAEETY